jgi:hypothetical protein
MKLNRGVLTATVITIVGTAFVGGWITMCSSPSDPHNFYYFMWKHRLWSLSYERIHAGMITDRKRDLLILGKSKPEIGSRVGPLTDPRHATPYLRSYYETGPYRDKDVAYLGKSALMVVFEHGRGKTVIIVKG